VAAEEGGLAAVKVEAAPTGGAGRMAAAGLTAGDSTAAGLTAGDSTAAQFRTAGATAADTGASIRGDE
jgi:hypothetical protein